MHEAKSQLSQLTQKALNGETIIIAKAGKALIRLVPHTQATKPRQPGAYKQSIQIDDGFDQADSDIEALFNGS